VSPSAQSLRVQNPLKRFPAAPPLPLHSANAEPQRAFALANTLLALTLFAGCQGGVTQSKVVPALVVPADFSLTLSSASLSIAQGGVSPPITVAVNAEHGFVDSVQITLTDLPAGITSNPASPFTIAAGANVAVILGAAVTTATGSNTVTEQAVSGSLSHSANFALSIQTSVLAGLPRTTYARTDAVPLADDPPSEPHHRHIVYDPANRHLFVADRALNRVEVFSTSNQLSGIGIGARVAQIDVPGASSADLSLDGSTVWVGTITEQVVAIDATLLRVRSRYFVQPMSPAPNTTFDRPEEILMVAGGSGLMRLRQSSAGQAMLVL